NARRMLGTGTALAAGSRHCDFLGETAHTIPFCPAASVDDTVRNPPGMPPGAGIDPDVTVMAADSAIGVTLSVVPLYWKVRGFAFSPIRYPSRREPVAK